MAGNFNQTGCGCCGVVCDTCCDCAPSSVEVILSGVHASVNGTWTCPYVTPGGTTCGWKYDDANVTITVNTNFDVTAVDKSGPTTRFTGTNTTDHKKACKRIESSTESNTVGGGTGTATVTGSCTPTCAADACAETFDPPVDDVPCVGCCPSCIPTQYSVEISGVLATDVCCVISPAYPHDVSIHYHGSFSVSASFVLTRFSNAYTNSPYCFYGDPDNSSSPMGYDPYWRVIGSGTIDFYDDTTCSTFLSSDSLYAWACIKWYNFGGGTGWRLGFFWEVFHGTHFATSSIPIDCGGGTYELGTITDPCPGAPYYGRSAWYGTPVAVITPC